MTRRPADLPESLVKFARRVRDLPDDRTYAIIVIKAGGNVAWSVLDARGHKIENARPVEKMG